MAGGAIADVPWQAKDGSYEVLEAESFAGSSELMLLNDE